MSPECLYWVALVALVLPSVPFNKTALIVLIAWAFGHFTHISGPYEDAAYMASNIVAIGAALAVSHPWDGSRRAIAQLIVTTLFAPLAVLYAYSAINFTHPPTTMAEWYEQVTLYWVAWGFIMAQAIVVPFGNDWEAIKRVADKFDQWAIGKIVKHFGGAL